MSQRISEGETETETETETEAETEAEAGQGGVSQKGISEGGNVTLVTGGVKGNATGNRRISLW